MSLLDKNYYIYQSPFLLNYFYLIIINNITAYSILLYIQGSQGILQVLMKAEHEKNTVILYLYKICYSYLVPGFFLESLMNVEFHILATMLGQILLMYFLERKNVP